MELTENNHSIAKSISDRVVLYAACSIIWTSKLRRQVVLSMTIAKYIDISISLCDVIPLMQLIKDMRKYKIQIVCSPMHIAKSLRTTLMHCMTCTYYHFQEHVRKKPYKRSFPWKPKIKLLIPPPTLYTIVKLIPLPRP